MVNLERLRAISVHHSRVAQIACDMRRLLNCTIEAQEMDLDVSASIEALEWMASQIEMSFHEAFGFRLGARPERDGKNA